MTVVELLGALRGDQEYYIVTADDEPEEIDVTTVARHGAKVLNIVAEDKNKLRIETNFRWCW